jgi:undecaprenyl-diphosphatase
MIWLDEKLFFLINGLAGKSEAADSFMRLVVGEQFIPVAMVMVLVAMWFLGKDARGRERNQRAVWTALIGVGFVSAAVALSNHFFDRPRPFDDFPEILPIVNGLFYPPTDSSFPSNSAAVGFAFGMGAWFGSRKAAAVIFLLAILWTFARVYCGVHYPLDIVGGAVIGIFCTFLAFGFLRLIEPLAKWFLDIIRLLYLA